MATRSENRTKGVTFDLPAGPPSLLISTSVPRGLLEPPTETGDGVDLGYDNDEERALFEIQILHEQRWLWPKVNAAMHFGKLAKQEDNVLCQKLVVWLEHVDTFNEQRIGNYNNEAVVKDLVKVLGQDRLAALLNSLRETSGVKFLAKVMQKAFAEAFPDNLELRFTVWIMERKPSISVYSHLPIGQRKKVERDGKRMRLTDCLKLEQWINYVDKSNTMGEGFSDFDVIEHLLQNQGADEVEKAFSALQNIPGMENRAEKLKWALNVKMVKFNEWLKTRKSPEDVFEWLEIDKEETCDFDQLKTRPDLICKLLLWLGYVDLFRAELKTFSEVDEFKLLLSKREPEEMAYFFQLIASKTGMYERSEMHRKRLFYEFPDRMDLLLPRYLQLQMTPVDVHSSMFDELLVRHKLGQPLPIGFNVQDRLLKWLRYVRDFNDQANGENQVFEHVVFDLLKKTTDLVEPEKLFDVLKKEKRMANIAGSWQRDWTTKHPPGPTN